MSCRRQTSAYRLRRFSPSWSAGARAAATVALNGGEDGAKRLSTAGSSATLRGRLARLTESGNLAWSAAAFLISLVALLPIIALGLIALKSSGARSAFAQRAGASP